jgi:sulfur carrier protein ThiS
MNLFLNGEATEAPDGATVGEFLRQLASENGGDFKQF